MAEVGMTWKPHPKSPTYAQINEHGDIVSKTFEAGIARYEAHLNGGASHFGFKSGDTAKAWVARQRKEAA